MNRELVIAAVLAWGLGAATALAQPSATEAPLTLEQLEAIALAN